MLKKEHYIQGTLFNEKELPAIAQDDHSVEFASVYVLRTEAMQKVIRQLRNDDLHKGHCFLIFDDELPEDHAYYEYPDGCIRVEKLNNLNIKVPRLVVKELNKRETAAVRKKHVINS